MTEHPTPHWTAQQIVDAFPNESALSYLLRDRDHVDGEPFRHRVEGMQIEEVLTVLHSPWQSHCDAWPWACSNTIRTACSRTSGENRLGLAMTPSSQGMEPPIDPLQFSS